MRCKALKSGVEYLATNGRIVTTVAGAFCNILRESDYKRMSANGDIEVCAKQGTKDPNPRKSVEPPPPPPEVVEPEKGPAIGDLVSYDGKVGEVVGQKDGKTKVMFDGSDEPELVDPEDLETV